MAAAQRTLILLITASIGSAIPLACSYPSRVGRPEGSTFAEATHSSSCKVAVGRNEPFIVDWPADRRADLEVLTKDRIPVVAYSCDYLRLLPECQVDGGYNFVGVTEQEESLKLEDTDEVRANLPFSGGVLAGKLSGEFARGSSVDIGFAIIGKRISTRRDIVRTALKGSCSDATHFVRATTVGAFAMDVGTKASMRAVADLFSAGGPGGTSTSKLAHSQAGELAACRRADSEALEPVHGCSAPIRLELLPVAEAETSTRVTPMADVTPIVCPSGLVPTDDGKCTHATDDKPHLCITSDPVDCEVQCTRGSAVSCAVYARRLQLGDGVPRDMDRAVRLYEKACKESVTPACGRLGEYLIAAKKPDEGVPLVKKSCNAGWFPACSILATYLNATGQSSKVDVYTRFRRACDGGDGEGCWSLGYLFTEGLGVRQNDGEAFKYFAAACDEGAKLGCVSYAKAIDEGKGTPSDPVRAAKLLDAACERGYSNACNALSLMYYQGRGVPKDPTKATMLLQRACDGTDTSSCFVLGMRYSTGASAERDLARAAVLFERACAAGLEISCRARDQMKKAP